MDEMRYILSTIYHLIANQNIEGVIPPIYDIIQREMILKFELMIVDEIDYILSQSLSLFLISLYQSTHLSHNKSLSFLFQSKYQKTR